MFKFDCGPKRATVVYRETCKWGAYNSTNSSTRQDFLSVGAEERDWNKRAVWENGWGRSDRGEKETEGSRRADAKANLTHLPRIPAPSDTINTFILSVLLSGEMKPQRSASGQKEAVLISLHSHDVEGWEGGGFLFLLWVSHRESNNSKISDLWIWLICVSVETSSCPKKAAHSGQYAEEGTMHPIQKLLTKRSSLSSLRIK